jgi:hypothetical protein
MTDNSIIPGCILHWTGFKLADGSEGHKFFVVVGARPGCNILAIRATSQRKRRDYTPGGNPVGGWYHIPGGARDWFEKDTWLLFEEPEEFDLKQFSTELTEGKLTVKGHLRGDIANAICNTMRRCNDVSGHHKSLLGPPIQPKKK